MDNNILSLREHKLRNDLKILERAVLKSEMNIDQYISSLSMEKQITSKDAVVKLYPTTFIYDTTDI